MSKEKIRSCKSKKDSVNFSCIPYFGKRSVILSEFLMSCNVTLNEVAILYGSLLVQATDSFPVMLVAYPTMCTVHTMSEFGLNYTILEAGVPEIDQDLVNRRAAAILVARAVVSLVSLDLCFDKVYYHIDASSVLHDKVMDVLSRRGSSFFLQELKDSNLSMKENGDVYTISNLEDFGGFGWREIR